MSHPALLKQSDLTRYAKAMQAAGVSEWRVDIKPDQTVSIIIGKTDKTSASDYLDRMLDD